MVIKRQAPDAKTVEIPARTVLVAAGTVPNITFFFNDTATTEIYTLSLHDALPISARCWRSPVPARARPPRWSSRWWSGSSGAGSEEHTSELQSLTNLVCRLLLEKKKKKNKKMIEHKKNSNDKH